MVVEDSTLQSLRFSGYPEFWSDVRGTVYALHPGNQEGRPITVQDQVISGSAVAVSDEGHFLTATHVIENIDELFDQAGLDYNLTLTCDPGTGMEIITFNVDDVLEKYPQDQQDVSVLKVGTEQLDHLVVRTGGTGEGTGQPVATFGYPHSEIDEKGLKLLQRTFFGVVSSVSAYDDYPKYEVDALFNPGLSGGPLVSLRTGEVIGIVHGTKWYYQEIQNQMVPYPGHISEAKVLTSFSGIPERLESIGERLEELGVDYSHTE